MYLFGSVVRGVISGGVRFKVIGGVTIYDDCNKEGKKQVIDWELLSNFMIAMLAIVNPVEKIPLWVAVTDSEKKSFEWLLGTLVISSCALISLIFLWIGRETLLALHVDLASFKIGGGLILLQFGFSMMQGTAVNVGSPGEGTSENLRKRVFQRFQQIFIPIGVPVIAGPGAITTVIIYGHQSDSTLTTILLSLTVIGVLVILFFTLLTGAFIKKMIGILPLDLTSRVFGMILIAISVQFMVEGLKETFPGWVK